jgi:hypothetical protein
MIKASWWLCIACLGVMLSTLPIHGQARPDYRDFTLGSPLARILEQVQVTAADVTLVHQRPALIQDLRWRTPYFPVRANQPRTDPVQQIMFSFVDGQLFRITIEYDRNQTEGMTDADMIAALSERYGPSQPLSRPSTPSTTEERTTGEWLTPVAEWADGDVGVALHRRAFTSGFQVVITSDRLARSASAESIRLDLSEAPARELARQKQSLEDAKMAKAKARVVSKAAFRP